MSIMLEPHPEVGRRWTVIPVLSFKVLVWLHVVSLFYTGLIPIMRSIHRGRCRGHHQLPVRLGKCSVYTLQKKGVYAWWNYLAKRLFKICPIFGIKNPLNIWVFLFQKYGKFWKGVLLDNFIKHKPLISEEYVEYSDKKKNRKLVIYTLYKSRYGACIRFYFGHRPKQ